MTSKEISQIKLADFMKALGYDQSVYADGSLRRYNAPYREDGNASLVINIETNQWRDTETGSYGGIYDLAYELTGSCNMSTLNQYILTQISES